MNENNHSNPNETAVSEPIFDPKVTSFQMEPIPLSDLGIEKLSESPIAAPIFQVQPLSSLEIAPPLAESVPNIAAEKASKAVRVHAKLLIERGHSAGKQFALSADETNIGRWDADGGIFPDVDLDADDPEAKISRRHARIWRKEDHYLIEDLGSTNGTFINRGRRLLPGDKQILNDSDEIIVGKTFLRFQIVK